MKNPLILVLALAACLFALPALADESQPAPVVAGAPTVTLTADQFATLVAKTTAGTPSAAAPAKAAAISAEGVLGVTWSTIAGWLGALALMIFGLFKSTGAIRARQMLVAAAEGAWHIAERAGAIYELDGATKGAIALEAFIKAMGGSVNAAQVTTARTLWESQSAKAGLAAPVAPAQLAQAQAAASAATAPGSAADLANMAAR